MELLIVGLSVVGLILMVFGLGAISGWLWAVKSLKVKPPAWIIGVTAAAGGTTTLAFALQGNWLSAVCNALARGVDKPAYDCDRCRTDPDGAVSSVRRGGVVARRRCRGRDGFAARRPSWRR